MQGLHYNQEDGSAVAEDEAAWQREAVAIGGMRGGGNAHQERCRQHGSRQRAGSCRAVLQVLARPASRQAAHEEAAACRATTPFLYVLGSPCGTDSTSLLHAEHTTLHAALT